jgi:pre-rRNA-processing protein TSR4
MESMDDGEELAHLVGVVEDIKFPFNSRFMFLPTARCDSCKNSMTFLLQIYAPDTEYDAAFHRSISVFICLTCRCFMRAYRSQLPLQNDYYGKEPLLAKNVPQEDEALERICCDNCGLLFHYDPTSCRPLPEFNIEIEDLEDIVIGEEDDGPDDNHDNDFEMEQEKIDQICKKSEMTLDESEADLFNDFTETAIENDKSFRIFKKLVEEAPVDHVLYYSIGGSPVWISDKNQLTSGPPPCGNCGEARQFEFQIQPQLIFHLMKRLRGYPMNAAPFEWGVVAVYTCSKNCSMSGYGEEFVYNQLEPAEWLEFDSRKKVDFTQDKKESAPKVASDSDDEGEWM